MQTACAINLQSLVNRESELRNREDFNAFLAREYLQYSRDLANRYNWRDSDYFAKKGLRAANNREIYPEVPEVWDIEISQMEELIVARKRLQLLLNPKVKYLLPIQLAHLTMLHDCWVSNEKNPWNLGTLSKCKTRFLRLSTEMEDYMANLKPKEQVQIVQMPQPEFKKFDIYFDTAGYKFNPDANKQFFELLDYLSQLNGNYRILLLGNTDRNGKKLYNDNLARRRVLSTKNMLIKNGVPRDLIETKSDGEETLEILTKDGQKNKYNRLVAVYVLKGADSLAPIPLPLIDNYIYKTEIEKLKKSKDLGE